MREEAAGGVRGGPYILGLLPRTAGLEGPGVWELLVTWRSRCRSLGILR